MLKVVFFASVLLVAGSAAAEKPVESNPVDSSDNLNQSHGVGPYSKYLACLNRLQFQIVEGVPTHTGESKDPEIDRNIFYGNVRGEGGIILLTPGAATFDEMSGTEPEFKYRTSSGMLQIHRFANRKSNGIQKGEIPPEVENGPLPQIGLPQAKVTESEVVEAIALEAIPRIESMPKAFAETVERSKMPWALLPADVISEHKKLAREALCACIKTGISKIGNAARKVADQLKLGALPECGTQRVANIY